MESPRRRFDPLALAVHSVAIALVLAVGAYLFVSLRKESFPAQADVRKGVEDLVSSLKKRLDPQQEVRQSRTPPPKRQPEKPVPSGKSATAEVARTAPQIAPLKPRPRAPIPTELIALDGAGRTWHYRVSVEPEAWRDATLTYRMVQKDGSMAVDTEFRHAGGKMDFHLGTFAAGHPSHANTRFPGFFMHAAYFNRPLDVGERFIWEWPWQLPGGGIRAGRVKRYVGEVRAWENLPAAPSAKAPMNNFAAARIEATLSYIEDGQVRATAAETLWFAPRFLQVVKVVRDGKVPDEGVHRIVAELVEHHY